jgi:hypothetical protein
MPDDRLFHKSLGHSQKVNGLTDLEDIVWRTYIQAADDFGVMRFQALPLQDAYDRLANRNPRVVQRALEGVAGAGLVHTFTHQGQVFCYQRTWQRYQKVEYPRTTIQPRPPDSELAECCELTRHLFQFHPGGRRVPATKDSRKNSGNDSGSFPGVLLESSGNDSGSFPVPHARARTLTANANGERLMAPGGAGGDHSKPRHAPLDPSDDPGLSERAGRFCERYAELYHQHRHGAHYIGKPNLDFLEALQLVRVWDDARLELLVTAFLKTDHEFAVKGSRTIAQFRSMASWCDGQLRERGL